MCVQKQIERNCEYKRKIHTQIWYLQIKHQFQRIQTITCTQVTWIKQTTQQLKHKSSHQCTKCFETHFMLSESSQIHLYMVCLNAGGKLGHLSFVWSPGFFFTELILLCTSAELAEMIFCIKWNTLSPLSYNTYTYIYLLLFHGCLFTCKSKRKSAQTIPHR